MDNKWVLSTKLLTFRELILDEMNSLKDLRNTSFQISFISEHPVFNENDCKEKYGGELRPIAWGVKNEKIMMNLNNGK